MNEKKPKSNFLLTLILFLIPWAIAITLVVTYGGKGENKAKEWISSEKAESPVDHSKFEVLQQEFEKPQDVTKACLTCHNKTHEEVMGSNHWTWSDSTKRVSGEVVDAGKRVSVNNFCVSISSNWARCTSCHAGYGWKDNDFDFGKAENIDCLVCHDQTGTYKKFPTMAGYPVSEPKMFQGKKQFLPPDYNLISQNVGKPTRKNCGTCHYTGGGGNNVKHGDLEMALNKTTRDVDVHMAIDGANMACVECHQTEDHNISAPYASTERSVDEICTCRMYSCVVCHSATPHNDMRLNQHQEKIACQTCHVPEYALVNETKMYWDWSTAGKKNNGKPINIKDSVGQFTDLHSEPEEILGSLYDKGTYFGGYMTKKGSFIWGKNIEPEYYWFNGTIEKAVAGDKFEKPAEGEEIEVNKIYGDYQDPHAKIYPMKVHRGRQPWDPETKMLIVPHLFGKKPPAYWKTYDWKQAAASGMASLGLPFSGKVDWIDSKMYWPINHMVQPKEVALSCEDCHSRNGRLENLAGFYLPGRDKNSIVDTGGFILLLMTIGGVLIHGFIRIIKK